MGALTLLRQPVKEKKILGIQNLRSAVQRICATILLLSTQPKNMAGSTQTFATINKSLHVDHLLSFVLISDHH